MPSMFRLANGPTSVFLPALALLGALAYLGVPSVTAATEIEVFTTQVISLTPPPDVAIIHLDTARRIEEELSKGLLSDQQHAESLVRQRLHTGGPELQRRLAIAWQGVADAWSLGITTLPAVVVDRRYVVYGEPDIAKAVARIEAYRRERE